MSDFDVAGYLAGGGSDNSGLIGTPDNDDPFAAILGDGNLFDGVDREELPDDPFALPKNMYKWRVVSAELKPTENNDKKFGIMFKYEVADGDFAKRMTQEWMHYWNPQDGSTEQQKTIALAKMNQLLKAFGLSDEQISQFNHRNYKSVLGSEFMCLGGSMPDRQDPSKKFIRLQGEKRPIAQFFGNDSGYDVFK